MDSADMDSAGSRTAYRVRLGLLATSGLVESQLDAWAVAQGAPVRGGWRRTYGRFRPWQSPWALLAYESHAGPTVRVELHDAPTPSQPLGRVEITRCDEDPALAGLSEVLRRLADPVIVRYRPGSRCTVRGGHGANARYVKVVAGQPDEQVDAHGLWEAACAGQLPFAVAEPLGCDTSTRSSWYGVVPGRPLAPYLLGPVAPEAAGRVGAALGALAAAPLVPTRRAAPADQLVRTGRTLARAAAAVPALQAGLTSAVAVLERAHGRLPDRRLLPVHGTAHAKQWLVDGSGRLGLVDFDRYALGEPELDLATFLVELENDTSRAVPATDIETALVAGFVGAGGEVDADRLMLYRVHKRLAKVARTATSLRPDGEERAIRRLDALADELALLGRDAG
jgi:hypothetical protein